MDCENACSNANYRVAYDDSMCSNDLSDSATLTLVIIFSVCGIGSFVCFSFCLMSCQHPDIYQASAHLVSPPDCLTPRSFWIIQDGESTKSVIQISRMTVQPDLESGESSEEGQTKKKSELIVAVPVY